MAVTEAIGLVPTGSRPQAGVTTSSAEVRLCEACRRVKCDAEHAPVLLGVSLSTLCRRLKGHGLWCQAYHCHTRRGARANATGVANSSGRKLFHMPSGPRERGRCVVRHVGLPPACESLPPPTASHIIYRRSCRVGS